MEEQQLAVRPTLHVRWQLPRPLSPKDLLGLSIREASDHGPDSNVYRYYLNALPRGVQPNKALQLTANSGFQLDSLVAFWRQPWVREWSRRRCWPQLSAGPLGSMTEHHREIPEDRDLSSAEARLIRWLLEHGTRDARSFIPQLESLRVVSRCPCGCPSISFISERGGGMQILSDYVYDDPDGHPVGVFAFASGGDLAGLEVWSIEGDPIPSAVPDPQVLRPMA